MKNIFCMIFVTCRSKAEAAGIARSLLEKRLVACANIMPGVDSRFWWQGKIDRAGEVMVIFKSVRSNFMKIECEVKRLHSYDVPEIIAVPIISGSKEYLDWISDSVNR